MRTIPFETLYVQWSVDAMVRYFRELGLIVYYDTVQEIAECTVPLDRILGIVGRDGIRVFAFQFKAPQQRSGHLVWRIDTPRGQFGLMRDARFRDWIWYALPFFVDHSEHCAALHLCQFVPPGTLCDRAKMVLWNGEVMMHYPCAGPFHLPATDMAITVGRHGSDVRLFRRTLEVRPRAREVGADPFTNVRESWGTLLGRISNSQFGLAITKTEEWVQTLGDADHPITGSGTIVAINTIHRVVTVLARIAPPHPSSAEEDSDQDFPDLLRSSNQKGSE